MQKILVFTDLHVGDDGQTIIGLDPLARFAEGLAHALRIHPDADHLIITGDLTHNGRPSQFTRVRKALADVPIPVTLMIGNHDNRDAYFDCFPDAPRDANGFAQTIIDLPDHRLICLDTYDSDANPKHSGYLCADRLHWLDQQIQTAGQRQVIVFTHHPPMVTGMTGMDDIRLRNGDVLLDKLRAAGVVQLISGHVHRTISGSCRGLPFAIFKSPCHQMPMILERSSLSMSVDEPGAYGILLIDRDAVRVHTEDFALTTPIQDFD